MKTLLAKKDGPQYLSRIPIALFDVYWLKSNGTKLKIHAMGSFISEKKINRLLDKPESFEFDWKVNGSWIIEGLNMLAQLTEIESERPQDLKAMDDWRVDFINWASPSLWYGDVTDVSFLDLFVLMSSFLGITKDDFYEGFDFLSNEVQARNLVVASTLTFLSLLVGYMDVNFLKDAFRTFLYLDFLYSEGSWEQREHEVIQKVMKAGVEELNDEEKGVVRKSYLAAAKKAAKLIEGKLHYPYVAQYLNWVMEDFKGEGVELKIKMNEMSDFELMVLLLVKGIGHEENLLEKNIERNINEVVVDSMNLSDRIRRVISSAVQVASEKNTNFLKISGL